MEPYIQGTRNFKPLSVSMVHQTTPNLNMTSWHLYSLSLGSCTSTTSTQVLLKHIIIDITLLAGKCGDRHPPGDKAGGGDLHVEERHIFHTGDVGGEQAPG